MNKLTKPARKYCQAALEAQGREALVEMLEGICIACYDEEDAEELAESAVDSIEAGDIDFDWGHGAVKVAGHYCYMLWLDIDDIWGDGSDVDPEEHIEVLIEGDQIDVDGNQELLPFSIPEGTEIWLPAKKRWSSVTAGGGDEGSPVGGQIIDDDNIEDWDDCRLRWPRG